MNELGMYQVSPHYSTFLLSIMTRLCKLCLFPPESKKEGIWSPGFHLLSQTKVLGACVGSEPAEKHLCVVLVTALLKVPDRLFLLTLLVDMHGSLREVPEKGVAGI